MDDYGAEGVRKAVEERLGRTLEDLIEQPPMGGASITWACIRRRIRARRTSACRFLSLYTNATQAGAIADIAASYGGDIRLTRQQNFILTGGAVAARADEIVGKLREIGFDLDVHRWRGSSIACTGQPLCNYAVAETKPKMIEIVERLESRFGAAVEGLSLGVDGCPHACAHRWISDIGLQGTTARGDGVTKQEAYEIYLRGGVGEDATIGRAVLRRVPGRPTRWTRSNDWWPGWLDGREAGESFQAFARRTGDEALVALAGGAGTTVETGTGTERGRSA